MVLATQMSNASNNAKNKKKKDKRKQQKLKKQNAALNADVPLQPETYEEREEAKIEEPLPTSIAPVKEQSESEEEEEESTSSNEDFCSNQQLIQMVSQNYPHKQQRNKGAIDEILNELLVFED